MQEQLPKFSQINLPEVVPNLEALLENNLTHIDQILQQQNPFTWQNLMLPIEELSDHLHNFWSPISHLHSVADSEELRVVYNECLPKLTEYNMTVCHNQHLYQAIQSIADSNIYQQLDTAQRKVIDHQLRDFKLAGVALPPAEQKEFTKLVLELSQLSTKFEENILDATKAWTKHITDRTELDGLPQMALQNAEEAAKQQKKSGWLLNLESPTYIAVITYADSSELRQEIYTASVTRASAEGPNAGQWDNQPLIDQILAKKLQLAKLLGFDNYAQESLATKMAESPQQVLEFFQELLTPSFPKAREEFAHLSEFAKEYYGVQELKAWDIAYYSEKLRQHAYAISQEELRPYFPEPSVLTGLFAIVHRLYGVRIEPMPHEDTWHSDARCYVIKDANDRPRSYFYLDLYARPSKRGGAWMDDCRVRRRCGDGTLQLPVAYVNCNFNGPAHDHPALFTHDEVITLFHEFGHALQHMLTKIDYADVAGINGIPWDAVEFPSQFFENWAWQRDAIDLFAEHYQTKACIPSDLYQRMWRARNFHTAMALLRQVQLALYDFRLHLEYDPTLPNQAQSILDEVRKQTSLMPTPAFNRFQNSFSHIFAGGYAAGYYSYLWAQVLASDAFELFVHEGIFNTYISHKFMTTILEKGGAEEPLDLFVQFRGRPPEVAAMLRQQGIITESDDGGCVIESVG